MLSEGSSSASEGTSAQRGSWQADRVRTQPLYPRGSALHLTHPADRLIHIDAHSALLDQGQQRQCELPGLKSKA